MHQPDPECRTCSEPSPRPRRFPVGSLTDPAPYQQNAGDRIRETAMRQAADALGLNEEDLSQMPMWAQHLWARVQQADLEVSALTSAILKRGLLTQQEMDQTLEETRSMAREAQRAVLQEAQRARAQGGA